MSDAESDREGRDRGLGWMRVRVDEEGERAREETYALPLLAYALTSSGGT
jgi:hypothetical protein